MGKVSKPGLFLFDLFYSRDYGQIDECLNKVREQGFYFKNIKCEDGTVSLIVVYGKVVLGVGLVPINRNEWDVSLNSLDEHLLSSMNFSDAYNALNLNNDYMDNQQKWRQMEGLDPISYEGE